MTAQAIDHVFRSVRYALRAMAGRPGFATVTILTMALGIAASTAVFSVVSAVLLKPLPYPDPDRIVLLVHTFQGRTFPTVSLPRLAAWRANTDAVTDIAVFTTDGAANLSYGDTRAQVVARRATASFFTLFGASAMRGRLFTADDDVPNGRRVAVLSHGFWQRHFGGAEVVGQTMRIDGDTALVVGVLSPAFDPRSSSPFIVATPDVWLPLQPDFATRTDANNLLAAARLRAGVSLATAQAQCAGGVAAFRQVLPQNMPPGMALKVVPLASVVTEDVQPYMTLLAWSVGFVQLIVIANTTCLMLVRAADRQREWAIRLAIGASGGHLVRQVLVESVMFGTLGGGLGLTLGVTGIRALLALEPGDIPRIAADGSDMLVDWRILLFAVLMSIGTSIVVGLLPALRASRVDVESSLRSGGNRSGTGPTHERTRALLVATQVALACMLLVGTTLLIRSFVEMHRVHPGFDSVGVLTMTTMATESRYARTEATSRLVDETVQAVRTVPGVEVAGATMTGVPLEGEKTTLRVGIAGHIDRAVMGGWHIVSPDYFRVLRTPILRGRGLTARDSREAPPVAIVNQALARRLWPTGDPMGDRVIVGLDGGPDFADVPRQVVGIAGDIRQGRLDRDPRPAVYVPLAQLPDVEMAFLNRNSASVTWMVRTSGAPHLVAGAVQQALRRATDAPVAHVQSLRDVAAQSTVGTQFRIWLMTLFAGSALLLAAIGIYGVASYSVQRRTREIGVRLALGATPDGIRRLVLTRGLLSTAAGLAAGLAIAFALARVLARFLFAVDPRDPVVFALVPCVLAIVALAAVWLPAGRATRVEPARALRMD